MVELLTVLHPFAEPPDTQSPNRPPKLSVPEVSPPVPTHLYTRMLVTAPPCVKVPSSRMSPTTWCAGFPSSSSNDPSAAALTGLLKNQKPMSLAPLTA